MTRLENSIMARWPLQIPPPVATQNPPIDSIVTALVAVQNGDDKMVECTRILGVDKSGRSF